MFCHRYRHFLLHDLPKLLEATVNLESRSRWECSRDGMMTIEGKPNKLGENDSSSAIFSTTNLRNSQLRLNLSFRSQKLPSNRQSCGTAWNNFTNCITYLTSSVFMLLLFTNILLVIYFHGNVKSTLFRRRKRRREMAGHVLTLIF
jgi:hypothetical protein